MNEALLAALRRRFAAQGDVLPQVYPALASDEPTAFLVRYRRDALHGLDAPQFRKLREAWREERDLERRRQSARRALEAAGELTEELGKRIEGTRDVAWLEDLVRPARRARRAAGPEAAPADPMSETARSVISGEATGPLDDLLAPFCGPDGAPPTAADQRDRLLRLVSDRIGAQPELRQAVRAATRRHGVLVAEPAGAHREKDTWKPFRGFRKPLREVKPRILLLLRRGQKTGALQARMELPEEARKELLEGVLAPPAEHPHRELLAEAARDALDRVLLHDASVEVLNERKRAAERSLLPGFAEALRERLVAAPAGEVPVVAVAPGSTGTCRLLVVDAKGRPAETAAVHPFPPRNEREESAKALLDMVRASGARLVAVAGSNRHRAMRDWVAETLASERELEAVPVAVNEVAAAAWAESEAGKAEAPELPATARVALSLGRYVRDPLSEIVRWDLPRIPLGPNQRDVDQGELRRRLDEIVEHAVAWVGVEVNTAHAELLARVPGLDEATARALVAWRTERGPFRTRAEVREVPGVSEAAWQRAGGFLRVRGSDEPLDETAVHPTGLAVVNALAERLKTTPAELIGRPDRFSDLDPKELAGEAHTESDVRSVLEELANGRVDPRGTFAPPAFNPGLRRLQDLEPGMEVEGVVTNLSKFGAFVDVGVRQDGLVHVSELAHGFVREPAEVVSVGQRLRVKVVAIDPAKRRISLSAKALLPVPERPPETERAPAGDRERRGPPARRERGPEPFRPERPGTAPRRAGRGGRPGGRGGDRERSGFGGFSGGDRGGRRGDRRDDGDRRGPPPRLQDIPRERDPFHQQLEALRAQLGFTPPAAAEPRRGGEGGRRRRGAGRGPEGARPEGESAVTETETAAAPAATPAHEAPPHEEPSDAPEASTAPEPVARAPSAEAESATEPGPAPEASSAAAAPAVEPPKVTEESAEPAPAEPAEAAPEALPAASEAPEPEPAGEPAASDDRPN